MFAYLGLIALCITGSFAQYLEVSGLDLVYKGEKVFLSGMNIAWELFGYDFGNDQYERETGAILEGYLRDISAAGGNSIREYHWPVVGFWARFCFLYFLARIQNLRIGLVL